MLGRKAKDDLSQSEKFEKAAREAACDESESNFDAALKKVAAHKPPSDPPITKPAKTKKPAK